MRLTHHPQPAQMPRASEGTERAPSQLPARGPSQRRRNRPESLSPPATPQPPPSRLVLCAVCSRPNCGAPHIFGRSNTRRSRADLVTATRGYRASAVATTRPPNPQHAQISRRCAQQRSGRTRRSTSSRSPSGGAACVSLRRGSAAVASLPAGFSHAAATATVDE